MNRKPHEERSFIILKPDTIQRSLVGDIVQRFERTGLKIVAMKMFVADEAKLRAHYNKDDAWCLAKGERIVRDMEAEGRTPEKTALEYGRGIIERLVVYMTKAPVVALVAEGNCAVGVVTKLVGSTEPLTSDVGTVRGDYTVDSYKHADFESRAVRNLVHCSESPEEAEREIAIWFTDDEIMKYVTASERILYDVNFDGVGE